jgi:hypothetical protein
MIQRIWRGAGVLTAGMLLIVACSGSRANVPTPVAQPPVTTTLQAVSAMRVPTAAPSATAAPVPTASPPVTMVVPAASPSATALPAPWPTAPPGAPMPLGRVIYPRFNGEPACDDPSSDAHEECEDLWSVALDGSNDQRLLSCATPCRIRTLAVSPDGRQVAYTVLPPKLPGPWSLHLMDRNGAHDRVLVPNVGNSSLGFGEQAFSPDGKRLVFVRHRACDCGTEGEQSAIWVLATGGGQLRQVTLWQPGCCTFPPAWADSAHLLFNNGASYTYRVLVHGDTPPAVLTPGALGEVAPDRTAVLIVGGVGTATGLAVVPLDPAGTRLQVPDSCCVQSVAWSPDGTAITFVAEGPPEPSGRNVTLQILRLDRGTPEVLQRLPVPPGDIDWDRDEQSLIYSVPGEAAGTVELRRLDLATGQAQTLTTFPGEPGSLAVVPP